MTSDQPRELYDENGKKIRTLEGVAAWIKRNPDQARDLTPRELLARRVHRLTTDYEREKAQLETERRRRDRSS